MTQHEHYPTIKPIRAGEDARIQLDIINTGDNATRDLTGATVSVTFTPELDSAFTTAGVLASDPAQRPQAYVDIADTDTTSMTTPQHVVAAVTVTHSDATLDKSGFSFELTA